MIPVLFNKEETTFTSLGLGEIDATVVEVERERNGIYSLYMELPFTSDYVALIEQEMQIKADAGARTKWQTFKVNRVIKDTDKKIVKVYADHISMDTINDAMKPRVAIRQQTAEGALRQWNANRISAKQYDVSSDISTISGTTWTIDEVENARQALGGVEGSILDVWGGEFEFDNNRIILHKEMGREAPTVLEYGRNIVSLEYEELIDGVYTSIYPYASYTPRSEDNRQQESVMVTLDELIVDGDYVGNYQNRRVQIVDFSSEFDSSGDNPEIPTQTKLRSLAKSYVKANEVGAPKITQEVDFVDLSKTLDYADMQIMEEIELNDRVPIFYPNIKMTSGVKVTKTVWQPLINQYKSITVSTIGALKSSSLNSDLKTSIKELEKQQKQINNTVPYLINAQGNRIWYTTPDDALEHKIGDTWFKKNGKYTIIYKWNGSMWEEVLNDETFITEIEAEVKTAISEAEKAKALAVSEAESALAQAKADATAKANAVKEQISGEVNTAISTAEDAKALAVSEAGQALIDAKAHTDAEVQASKEHFDGLIAATQSDVSNAQATADSAVEQIDTAVANAGFASLDDTINNVRDIASGVKSELDIAIENAGFTSLDEVVSDTRYLGETANSNAQTAISESQTAQANSLAALGKADNALSGVSNLDIRVDDVEAELELKADNTFMNEDGTLTTLSNAITFNANRFSSDMQRIESRVESLAGEINLVILKDAHVGKIIRGTDIYPNPTEDATDRDTMRDLIEVSPNEQLAFSKKAGSGWARIHQYDESYNNIQYLSFQDDERLVTTLPNAKYVWISYPRGGQPQLIRGTEFLPYRPNLVDQMTSDEVVLFRNEYDEFAEGTKRRIIAIDGEGGRLETAETLINQTAEGLSTTVGRVDDQEDRISTVEQTAEGLQATVASKASQSQVTQLATGLNALVESKPKNLLTNGDFSNENVMHGWSTDTNVTFNRMLENVAEFYSSSGMYLNRVWNVLMLETGKKYKITIDARANVSGRTISLGQFNGLYNETIVLSSTLRTYEVIYEASNDSRIGIFFNVAGTYGIGNIAVVETTTVSKGQISVLSDSITQSISTLDGRVTTQEQTLDSISSTVSGHGERISTVEQTASGLQSTVADKASQSQVTQLANGLSSVVESLPDSLIPDNNNLTNGRWGGWLKDLSITFNRAINEKTELFVGAQGTRIWFPSIKVQVGKKYKITFDMRSNVTGRKVSVGGWEPAEHRIGISSTSQSYEVVFEPRSTNDFSIYFYDTGTYEIGNVRVFETTLISETKISQLANNINLRVAKGELLSQFNIEAGRTLIQSNKLVLDADSVVFTGDAFIPSAQIESVHADKINAGTINSARINATEIVTNGLTANVVESTHIKAEVGLVDKIFADEARITRLTSNSIFASKIKAIEIDASKITSGELAAARIKSKDVVTQGLTADVVKATHIKAEAGLVDKLFSQTAYIEELTNKTVFTEKIQAINISADKITTGTLDAGKVKVINIDANNITANKTEFIKSTWNDISSDVAIDGSGIKTQNTNGDFSRIVSGELRSFNANSSSTAILGSGRSQYFDENGSQFILGKTLHGTNWVNDGTLQVTYNRRFAIGRYADYAGNNGIFHPYIALEYAPDKPGDEPNGIVRLYKAVYLQKGIYAGNNDISALSKISFYNGGLIESQSSTSNLLITASNKMVAYAAGTNAFEIDSGYMYLRRNLSMEGNNITNQSDRRLKTNIVDTPVDSLSAISNWGFKSFDRVNNGSHDDIGLIAQDTSEIVVYDEENDIYNVNSSKQIMMNSHGIQQLNTKVDDEITQLKAQIASLQDELAQLKGA